MRRILASLALLCLPATGAFAQCGGQNLLATLPAEEQSALRTRAEAAPFAVGNLWRATKGDEVAYLVGTYHLDDPRHAAALARVDPILATATTLLVEAGPEEEAALMARVARDPGLILNADGPTLPEVLPKEEWQRLSAAMRLRGVPPFMAAKFRPWYLTVILGIPACAMPTAATAKGLDSLLIDAAQARGVPVQSLEPYDTVFGIFQSMSQSDQLAMIASALAMELRSEDFAATLADSYFAEEGRLIWEFMRSETAKLPGYTAAQADAELAVLERAVMIARNRAWIPVIEAAAAHGPVLVAFGALHLSGDAGVLALLQAQGFAVERLSFR